MLDLSRSSSGKDAKAFVRSRPIFFWFIVGATLFPCAAVQPRLSLGQSPRAPSSLAPAGPAPAGPAPAGSAQAWNFGPFTRPANDPVIAPDPTSVYSDPVLGKPIHWEALHTFNPAAAVLDGKIMLLYRAEDDSGSDTIGGHTSRLGLASSSDGIHFTRLPAPVFYPSNDDQHSREWPGGVEDPRLVQKEDGLFVLTYTQWNRATYTVGVATSRDLRHWTKYGPIFAAAANGKYQHLAYKSAGILTQERGGRLVAARVHGTYWMYWGEIQVRLATSTDLIHWNPVEDADGEPKVVLRARPGLFDSGFPEVGPPPVLRAQGIVLLYNGKNAAEGEDPNIGPGAYSAGQALFSSDDPSRLIDRPKEPYLKPELSFERSGQYTAGTVFTEGLVLFQDQWWLYYGAADSFVGVARAPR